MDGTLPLIIFASAGMLLSSIYTLSYVRLAQSPLRSALKTGSVALLGLAALLGGAPWLLALALFASAAGDYALSRDGQRAFLAGMGAFALAHLAYIALMLQGALWFSQTWQWVVLAALALLCLGMIARLWPAAGELRLPVTVYALIIGAMGAVAVAYAPMPFGLLALIGAGLFIASDTVLAVEQFLLSPEARAVSNLPRIIWVLYYSAQLCLTVALGGLI